MFQNGTVFEEILTLVLLVGFFVVCVAIPGAIANREEKHGCDENKKNNRNKEVV